jgi:homoserine kinase type II
MDSSAAAELRQVLAQYDLGELVEFQRIDRGFVNTAYAIRVLAAEERKRYCLRRYRRGIREEEVVFEHSLIEHLVGRAAPVARIHHARSGKSYLRFPQVEEGLPVYFTIFEYLPGEDRFTWVDPALTEQELASSAAVLAQLHTDAAGFTPLGRRMEPRLVDLLPLIAATWSGCSGKSRGTAFDARMRECADLVSSSIGATHATLTEPSAFSLPAMTIHGDYHPGNLKFIGHEVSGVFDFDWSKIDFRLFDLGLALWYFCTAWRGAEDGMLRLDRVEIFLRSYLEALAARPGQCVMTPAELHYLPTMVDAGNIYVLHWIVLDYFAKAADPSEYLRFLDHGLNFIRWSGRPAHRPTLERTIASAVRQPFSNAV